ncbi:hypothetical protein BWI96_12930 [Siphonobacter sp. SORGH_AS_0500]|uniref:outer membrane beta-barrel protein n=1 Tax=Siphonobacter sp. SORGH_AS_0500 TaxID=1864824 RepID=UPI000CB1D592|nr:outer membrane beta-barrel protein [Siphonobacter sp. SORGH_AS_0500]PKK36290.1 hypothetical protein BWI96_12930 [Siphonobacter sp. SORGH_AS_0500]
MKKLLFTSAFVFSIIFAQAQANRYHPSKQYYSSTDPSEVRFGLKAGVNLANVIVSPRPGNLISGRTDFHAGLFVEVPISEKVSFQPELLYSRQAFA